jgi:arsenite methyltransferase
MKARIIEPIVLQAAGNKPKTIEEYIGRLATENTNASVARMISPAGWQEPAQTPEFDEYTVVLRGAVHAETDDETLVAGPGQAILAPRGVRIRYSTPLAGGAEYVAVCCPAFSPELVHREPLPEVDEPAQTTEQNAADAIDVNVYDDLPLWSAPFGLALLETVRMRRGMVALDVGSGAGFPLVELAQRLGADSQVIGLDPWTGGFARIHQKLRAWNVPNVRLIEGRAESIPLDDASVDLVISNNGFNNVQDPERALAECWRVGKPGAQMVFTFNLPESMIEVYRTLEQILRDHDDADSITRLREHIYAKRKLVAWWVDKAQRAGFTVTSVVQREFTWRFSSSQALFDHGFWRLAFIPSWQELVPPARRAKIFAELQKQLDHQAALADGLTLTIPYACVDCTREAGGG